MEVNGTSRVETPMPCPVVGYRYRPSTFGCRCASSEAGLTSYPYTLSTGALTLALTDPNPDREPGPNPDPDPDPNPNPNPSPNPNPNPNPIHLAHLVV